MGRVSEAASERTPFSPSPRILILGSGALATLFAARLAGAGTEITVLASWAEAIVALNEKGARLEGGWAFPVHATNDPRSCPPPDYALVLVKGRQTQRAAAQLSELLPPQGIALSLQNGLGNIQLLAEALGQERVFQGVTSIGATLLAPGLVRLCGEGTITLPQAPSLLPLVKILRRAGFTVKTTNDILTYVWGKLIINASINPLTALLRVKNGLLLESPFARQIMGQLAEEAAAVAAAYGIKPPFDQPKKAVEEVARQTAENLSSMLQDVLRGVETEIDTINGAVVRLGEARGVPAPVNRLVWSLVKAIPIHDKISPLEADSA